MTLSGVLMPLPVLIPLTAAALTLIAGRRPRLQRLITVVALSAVLAVCAVLVYLIVVGLVLDVLRSLGARIDVEMAETPAAAVKARAS